MAKELQKKSRVKLLDEGVSEIGERFVSLEVSDAAGNKVTVIERIDKLAKTKSKDEMFERLNARGAHLIHIKAQNELIARIQAEGGREPAFQVATQVGWTNGTFILPDRVIGTPQERLEAFLGGIKPELTSKYRCTGNLDEWREIPELARGNSRLMLSLALAFVGPIGEILKAEQVAVQLCGNPGSGKTGVVIAASSVWGLHTQAQRAQSSGFGETWKNTVNNLEPIAVAHNHTFLILEETRLAAPRNVLFETLTETAMRLERSVEKGRLTDSGSPRSWWVPVLSSSNKSLDEIAKAGELDDAYRDRLIDVPLPTKAADGIFENLHHFKDKAKLTIRLMTVAFAHHGVASVRFLEELTEWRARDAKDLGKTLKLYRRLYLYSARRLESGGRDVTRIHGKFATIYAAGRLAAKFDLLPWKPDELRDALLACERAHIEHVAKFTSPQTSLAHLTVLREYIQAHEKEFVDLRKGSAPPGHDVASCAGYVNQHAGAKEYLFTDERFAAIANGKDKAQELKRHLFEAGLITKTKAGEQGDRFATKRKLLAGKGRHSVIAVNADILNETRAISHAKRGLV